MKSPFSASIQALILTLCSTTLAVPAPGPNADLAVRDPKTPVTFIDISNTFTNTTASSDAATTLERRGGSHSAHFCEGSNCGGNYAYANNFGCGGYCYNGFSAASVYLDQATNYNPYPTATLYTNGDCSGSSQSAGISGGYYSGCTNSNVGTWHSAYLYFNC